MKKISILFALLVTACSFQYILAQDADFYPITEHPPGKWMAFTSFVPLNVQHKLNIQGLLGYTLTFKPDFEVKSPEKIMYLFRFEETGNFNPGLKPQLPSNTHIQFIIDGSPSAELPVRKISFTNNRDVQHIIKFAVVIPPQLIEKITGARTVRGLIYYREQKKNEILKNDVKSITFDAKTLRSLDRLVSTATAK